MVGSRRRAMALFWHINTPLLVWFSTSFYQSKCSCMISCVMSCTDSNIGSGPVSLAIHWPAVAVDALRDLLAGMRAFILEWYGMCLDAAVHSLVARIEAVRRIFTFPNEMVGFRRRTTAFMRHMIARFVIWFGALYYKSYCNGLISCVTPCTDNNIGYGPVLSVLYWPTVAAIAMSELLVWSREGLLEWHGLLFDASVELRHRIDGAWHSIVDLLDVVLEWPLEIFNAARDALVATRLWPETRIRSRTFRFVVL